MYVEQFADIRGLQKLMLADGFGKNVSRALFVCMFSVSSRGLTCLSVFIS